MATSTGGTERTRQEVGQLQTVPQFAEAIKQLGQNWNSILRNHDLDPGVMAQDRLLRIAPLSGLERSASAAADLRLNNLRAGGNDTLRPWAENVGMDILSSIRPASDAYATKSADYLGGVGRAATTANPLTLEGANVARQFTSGDFGNSPMVQAAIRGIEQQTMPQVQNAAARFGLAQSGELPREIGQLYASTLVPLYGQGLQQQQRAGQDIAGIGQWLQNQAVQGQLGAAQGWRDINQQMMTGRLATANAYESIANAEEQRRIQAMREASSLGGLSRMVDQAENQAAQDLFQRQREMSMQYNNPFGNIAVAGSGGQTNRQFAGSGGLWSKG